MKILEMNNVTKKFGKFTALDGVSFSVDPGEVYGFIGPNGAGKSTSIRIILGILQATNGSAKVFGKDSWKDAVEIHKRLTYVPGDVNLWPNLTGGEVIDMFMRMHGSGANKKKKEELLDAFDLDPTKKCRTYSKGNRQKVALVAAFASDAELFILDEPTSGLDPLMEKVFHSYVEEVVNDGKAVLLSSHILSEVEKLCDRLSIIRQGKVIESGTLEEMRHLRRTNITVETVQPLDGLDRMEGIFNVSREGNVTHFQLEPKHTTVAMTFLAERGIIRLDSAGATLEDLFMDYYKNQ